MMKAGKYYQLFARAPQHFAQMKFKNALSICVFCHLDF